MFTLYQYSFYLYVLSTLIFSLILIMFMSSFVWWSIFGMPNLEKSSWLHESPCRFSVWSGWFEKQIILCYLLFYLLCYLLFYCLLFYYLLCYLIFCGVYNGMAIIEKFKKQTECISSQEHHKQPAKAGGDCLLLKGVQLTFLHKFKSLDYFLLDSHACVATGKMDMTINSIQ